MTYFGVNLRDSKYGFNISRQNYAIIDNQNSVGGDTRSDDWCKEYFERCLENFDLNMKYFSSLDKNEFSYALAKFLKKNRKFVEIFNLNIYSDTSGYYILVLDEFRQVYVGTSSNIKNRIMSHWSKRKQFDRLLFGTVFNSIISIDSFRALDTTRIFVCKTNNTYGQEDKYIKCFPAKFLLNRTAGGFLVGGLFEASTKGKTRDLK